MIHIEINPSIQTDLASDLLERAALAVLAQQSADGDLTIVLTDDAQLHELNRDYLGIDAPTDVLSFPASETDPETARRYLGDILISVQRANEQARAAGHDAGGRSPVADRARRPASAGLRPCRGR